MKTVIAVMMALALMCVFSQAVPAKTVYMKNGDEIDCRNAWVKDGKVNVLINRDTLVDFTRDEVDMNKTFGQKPPKKKVRHHKKRHGTVGTVPKPVSGSSEQRTMEEPE